MSGSKKGGSGGGWGVIIGLLILLALLIYGISAIGHVLGLTPTGTEVLDGEDGFVKKNYEGVAVGYILTVAIVLFVVGATFYFVRQQSGTPDENVADIYRGLGVVAVFLFILVLVLPAGQRADPLGPSVSQLAAKREQNADREAEIRTRQRERAREQARIERQREQARERRLEARAQERRRQQREQQAAAAPQPVASSECDPNYSGACLDPNASDYDCEGGEGDGPKYTGQVTVVGSDVYDLDTGDGDPAACEPY